MNAKQISARVRRLRDKKDWSRKELADRAGIHPNTVKKVERNCSETTLKVIEQLARAFKLGLEEFVYGRRPK